MSKNLTAQRITGSGIFTVPAGVGSIRVSGIPQEQSRRFVSNSSAYSLWMANGEIWGAGFNEGGQLGDDTLVSKSTPTLVAGNRKYKDLSSSSIGSIALDTEGNVYTWGPDAIPSSSSPVLVSGLPRCKRVYCGGSNFVPAVFFALSEAGDLYGWGDNTHGQLGDGTSTSRSTPTLVIGGHKFKDARVLLGFGFNYSTAGALTNDGDIYTWGSNLGGQLGDNTNVSKSTPTLVAGGRKYRSFCMGQTAAFMAQDLNGDFYSWPGAASVPTIFPFFGGGEFKKVSVGTGGTGGLFVLGIDKDSKLYGGGDNSSGQLGDGTTVDAESSIVAVNSALKFIDVYAGEESSFALAENGDLYVWGNATDGVLGLGDEVPHSEPVLHPLSGVSPVGRDVPESHTLRVTPGQEIEYSQELNIAPRFGNILFDRSIECFYVEYFS